MVELEFDMKKKEFENVVKTGIANVCKYTDDVSEEEIAEYDFIASVSGTGRELGFADIVTKKRDGNAWERVKHRARVVEVARVADGWEFVLKLL